MVKQTRRIVRDPYFYWKIINLILAVVILILAALILLGGKDGWFVFAALFLGMLMSTFEGIMQLAKGRRLRGYTCSIFAGMMAVALIVFLVCMIW